jgi:hypothetical protein
VEQGELEALGHHPDDGVCLAPQLDRASHGRRICIESCSPHVVAKNDGERGAHQFITLDKRASQQGWHARSAEARRGHFRRDDGFDRATGDGQIAPDRLIGRETLDRSQLFLPGQEVVLDATLLVVGFRIPNLESDDSVPLLERKLGIEDGDSRREDSTDRDDDCHAQTANQRQAGIPHEHPKG